MFRLSLSLSQALDVLVLAECGSVVLTLVSDGKPQGMNIVLKIVSKKPVAPFSLPHPLT